MKKKDYRGEKVLELKDVDQNKIYEFMIQSYFPYKIDKEDLTKEEVKNIDALTDLLLNKENVCLIIRNKEKNPLSQSDDFYYDFLWYVGKKPFKEFINFEKTFKETFFRRKIPYEKGDLKIKEITKKENLLPFLDEHTDEIPYPILICMNSKKLDTQSLPIFKIEKS
jgi:hypothetical protein